MKLAQYSIPSEIGTLFLVASEKGLRGVYWKKQNAPLVKNLNSKELEIKILSQAVRELREYFSRKRKKFEVPLDQEGTPFQTQVWKELMKIPYGKTCSYGEIAKRIKNHKAVRAVGTANGKNHIPIIVPCHRVISSDGKLGGYAGGLKMKTTLLLIERALNQDFKIET